MSNKPEVLVSGDVVRISFDEHTDMGAVNELVDAMNNATMQEIERVTSGLGVSRDTASAIVYLRTRSRWTQEMEDKIVAADKVGTPIDTGAIVSGDWRG